MWRLLIFSEMEATLGKGVRLTREKP